MLVKKKLVSAATTWPATVAWEVSPNDDIAVATTAGMTAIFQYGQEAGATKGCLPVSASTINRNIMQ